MIRYSDAANARRSKARLGRNDWVFLGLVAALCCGGMPLQAEDVEPVRPSVANEFKESELKQARYKDAIRSFSAALRLKPDDVSALLGRAEAYRETYDFALSLADYSEVIRLDPKNAAAFRGRSRTHSRCFDLKASLTDLNETIRLDPRDRESLWFRSQYYSRVGKFDEAEADLTAAIAIDPQEPLPYLWRARHYEQWGRFFKAEQDYASIVLLDPASSLSDKVGAAMVKLNFKVPNVAFEEKKAVRAVP
jgi:tetratricopeptide (TPR) repeat protein